MGWDICETTEHSNKAHGTSVPEWFHGTRQREAWPSLFFKGIHKVKHYPQNLHFFLVPHILRDYAKTSWCLVTCASVCTSSHTPALASVWVQNLLAIKSCFSGAVHTEVDWVCTKVFGNLCQCSCQCSLKENSEEACFHWMRSLIHGIPCHRIFWRPKVWRTDCFTGGSKLT